MIFHIITIFPEIFNSYLSNGIVSRALKSQKIQIKIYDLRDYAVNKYGSVDDTPFGGGPGMVLRVEPVFECIEFIKKEIKERRVSMEQVRVILTSARGEIFSQKKAVEYSNLEELIFICGRYEGVDERVAKYLVDEELSVGPYILTGGELPALTVVDAVSRLVPGVLGNQESLFSESFSDGEVNYDYPVYTKPREFNGWEVPEVLISGNHAKINKWRNEMSYQIDKNKKINVNQKNN